MFIAHRGESFVSPENTLASINLAWCNNVKSVEIDIRQTMDNEIVVIHDKDTCRVSQSCFVVKKTRLKQLKSIDVGLYKGTEWKNERIPTLKEVLGTVPQNGKLIIEIKTGVDILKRLNQDLSQSVLEDKQLEIIASDLKTLAKAKQIMPQYRMLWLLELDYFLPWWLVFANPERIIRKLKKFNLDGINVWSGKIISKRFIAAFKNAGFIIYVWTENNIQRAKWLIENKIDGITTDRALWMEQQLTNEKEKIYNKWQTL